MITAGCFKKRLADVPDSAIVMVRVLTGDYDPIDGSGFWTTSLVEGDIRTDNGYVHISAETPPEYRHY